MRLSRPQIVELLDARSTAIAGDLVEPLAHFLQVARKLVQHDADKVLLMLIIIVRANLHPDYRKLDPADIRAGRVSRLPSLGVNLRSLAESTGIPKETVRRKVQELIEAGWVERQGSHLLYTLKAYEAADPARQALLRMAARNYEVVAQVIAEDAAP
jgi:hypothetical protein